MYLKTLEKLFKLINRFKNMNVIRFLGTKEINLSGSFYH